MKVLVAVDRSSASKDAVNSALDLARELDEPMDLELVHCVSPVIKMDGDTYEESLDNAEEHGKQSLESASSEVDNSTVDLGIVNHTLLHSDGDIVDSLSEHINDNSFDMVFMGHRDQSEKKERFVGSTTKKLISRSEVPVVAV